MQNPGALVPLLRAIHPGTPRVLGEDFSAAAAVSRCWLAQVPRSTAIAADLDQACLDRARALCANPRLHIRRCNVLTSTPPGPKPDLIFVGNFSICEIHARKSLVAYFRRCRSRLADKGVFVCDIYGGESAFRTGHVQRMHEVPGDDRMRIRYTWQQRHADPITAMVENALQFRVLRSNEVINELTDAFVYRWRLWSLSELREAMLEAGFARVEVFNQLPDAQDADGTTYAMPIRDPADLDDSYIVCVAAFTGPAGRTRPGPDRR